MNDSRYDRLEDKIDKIKESVDSVVREQIIHTYRLNQYNESLDEHMRRTAALEKQVGLVYIAKICLGTGSTVATVLGIAYKVGKSLGYL